MRPGLKTLGLWVAPLVLILLYLAAPALAQEAAGGGGGEKAKTTSYFIMFFWSGDVIGKLMIWVLIIMSISVMALIIHFLLQNRIETFAPVEAVIECEQLLQEKRFREAIERCATDESVFGQIMHASLSEASNGFGSMERAIEETADLISAKKIRSLEYLNVLGAVGPMVGLFGTVYGMIVAFQQIVDAGGQPNPADLAAGISTALVTTFWGLIVGIPAVAAAALIRNKVDALTVEAMIRAEELIGQFRPGAKKGAASGAAGAGAKGAAGARPAAPGAAATPKPKPA